MSKMDIVKTFDQVAWCLENKSGTRSDDNLLTISVWKNFHEADFKNMLYNCLHYMEIKPPEEVMRSLGNMNNLPSSEACSRARRRLNAKGKFLPSPGTVNKRRRKEFEVHEWSIPDHI